MSTLPAYAELHTLSNFTFLRGASHPEELVAQAAALGYSALSLTDECSLAGVVRAHTAAREHGVKLLIGSEIRLDDGPRLVLLAADTAGYGNLSTLITTGRRRAAKGEYRLEWADLVEGLPGCLVLWIPECVQGETPLATARWLAARFPGRAWLAVERHLEAGERSRVAGLERLGRESGLPLVAAGEVYMHQRSRRPLQDLLTAIRLGTTVAAAGHALFPNGERYLRPRHVLQRLYRAEWLAESVAIADRCTFSLDQLRYDYPIDVVPEGESPDAFLRRLTRDGMAERWPEGAPERVQAMVAHELQIIEALDYAPYFLTVHDIVRFARERGILCQGRGSAANSAVCYCLGITAVDPSRMEMLFERFVSKERGEPPDIDVDFEHERREEVIQYIYRRYGRGRAALAATLITYRRRSALRDAGKALGLEPDAIDRLLRQLAWWDAGLPDERVREAGLDPQSPPLRSMLELVPQLIGFPRHLSQHVGGFVISRGPLARLVPIENAAMAERSVIQWDKDDLDALGLLKVDVLGLGMLSVIRRAFALVARHRGRQWTLGNLPAEDPAVYEMLCRADTIGVFQIESRAQMNMLPRLRPRCFYDLVIEVALVRPGPIQGEMVHPYLKRRQGREAVTYPSAAVRAVLARTLGVPIFQEQVIRLAMVAAGFSAGDADALRRAIGAWRKRDTLARFRQKLLTGMTDRGYTPRFAEQIYAQIQGFGEYGFPESHAASFALLVYVSAWLKRHEPAAYLCALLNAQPMGFYAPAQLIQDGRRHGVEVHPVDVGHSNRESTLEASAGAPAVRLGLHLVKGLSRQGAERVAVERPFRDVPDLVRRARLTRSDQEALAAAGALSGLAGDRHTARWQVLGSEASLPLFPEPAFSESAPPLPTPGEGADLIADYASLGFTLGRHPLALLRPRLRRMGCIPADRLAARRHGSRIQLMGLVITRQHPARARHTLFLTLEDETGVANLIVQERETRRYHRAVVGGRLLRVYGELRREGEVINVVTRHLEDHTHLLGGLQTKSRDFC